MRFDQLKDLIARSAVRKVVYVVVAVALAWTGMGRAHAGCVETNEYVFSCDTITEAYNVVSNVTYDHFHPACSVTPTVIHESSGFTVRTGHEPGTCLYTYEHGIARSMYNSTCQSPLEWNEFSNQCDEACSSMPPNGSGWSRSTADACQKGCIYSNRNGDVQSVVGSDGVPVVWYSKKGMTATGGHCSPSDGSGGDGESCAALGSGQTACMRPDGRVCYSTGGAASHICWSPGETGLKTAGDTLQKTNAGESAIPPASQLPSGDTLAASAPPLTRSTTSGTSSSTTTTRNYKTTYGTNADSGDGSLDDAVGIDVETGEVAAGSDGQGSGDGDGEGNSATGGVDCSTPPVVTGDAALGMIATQTWATRCAAEQSNKGDSNENGQPDWTEQTTPPDVPLDEANDGETSFLTRTFSADVLDQSGFGLAGSCPSLGVLDFGFTTFSFDSWPGWCGLVSVMRAIVLLFGAFTALRILLGE